MAKNMEIKIKTARAKKAVGVVGFARSSSPSGRVYVHGQVKVREVTRSKSAVVSPQRNARPAVDLSQKSIEDLVIENWEFLEPGLRYLADH